MCIRDRPALSVSASSVVPFDGSRVTKPVQFYLRSNYPDFAERYEVAIYRGNDTDLVAPIATVPMDVAGVSRNEWDGTLPSEYPFRAGDELVYVLRAHDAEGNVDETYPRRLQLVRPEDAERGGLQLRDNVEKSLGTALTVEQAQTQSLIDGAFAQNDLRQQNIPIYGSRVRIQGRNLPERSGLKINGESYPVDLERKFVAEYLVPVGRHAYQIEVGGEGEGGAASRHTLDVDVSGRYFFGVGIADLTVYQNKVSGSAAPFAIDRRHDDILTDGRLAFYGKAKVGGKYLFTAQADTQELSLIHI